MSDLGAEHKIFGVEICIFVEKIGFIVTNSLLMNIPVLGKFIGFFTISYLCLISVGKEYQMIVQVWLVCGGGGGSVSNDCVSLCDDENKNFCQAFRPVVLVFK